MGKPHFTLLTASLFIALTAPGAGAKAAPRPFLSPAMVRVEIPLLAVLTPETGWDDNDNLQLVLVGRLPDLCHTLGEYRIETRPGRGNRMIHQYAYRNNTGPCAQNTQLPANLQMVVPFSVEASMGPHTAGYYHFAFRRAGGDLAVRHLNVKPATSLSVDSLPYAAVTALNAPDIVQAGAPVKIVLQGVFSSSCVDLDPRIRFIHEKDVEIIQPQIRMRADQPCLDVMVPFEKRLRLRGMPAGLHLIHVRSMNGRALNRIVEVMP